MTKHHLLVPGILAATTLALSAGVGAQTSQAAPMTGHHKDSAAAARHEADMKAECQAMMAKKQEMQDKVQAMDATLDKLVAEMNAAQGDSREKAMAAVVNELVAQRKVLRAMTMEMQPPMMAHMMHHHMDMQAMKGGMECPMMKTGPAHEPKADDTKPKM